MSTAGESVSSLMIECDNNEEFIIANLSSSIINETLDLAFNEGEKICFKVNRDWPNYQLMPEIVLFLVSMDGFSDPGGWTWHSSLNWGVGCRHELHGGAQPRFAQGGGSRGGGSRFGRCRQELHAGAGGMTGLLLFS